MSHIHKHNIRLLKQYLRKRYTNDELIELSNRLPTGFAARLCLSATQHIEITKSTADNDQSIADIREINTK